MMKVLGKIRFHVEGRNKTEVVENRTSKIFSFLVDIIQFLLTSRVFKTCLSVVLIINIAAVFVAVYTLLYTFDGMFLLQYGPVMFGVTFMIASSICLFIRLNEILEAIDDSKTILEHVSYTEQVSPEVEKERKKVLYHILTNIFLASIVGLSYALVDGNEQEKFFFPCKFLRDNYPHYSFLPRLYLLTFPVIGVPVLLSTYTLMYAYINGLSYATIIYIRFEENCISVSEETSSSQTCQLHIYESIISFVDRYQEIYGFVKKQCDNAYLLIIVYTVTGFFLCLSVIFAITHGTYTLNSIGRLTCIALSCIHMAILYFTIGQGIQDEFRKIEVLLSEAPWYNWDQRNQKTFLFALMAAQRTVALAVSNDLVVNYEFAVDFLKFLFSFTTMLMSCTNK